ncbi:acyl-[acyl-carrier-protein] thioesterase [Clostridium beijerinckii]|uniref:acyl-[acyl-carrier-protein] thioesterase n=1 Tax=Clostridium beijerinckii TaxID=1520 RepID=UPI00098BFE3D|nr:acyl-ACP thioesterase domain-containing protein [Clostridium beijerinckii]MBA8936296.1 acyl-ACP thioesterase [Clostridium beijerinckii]NRT32179.1 acyl-ACP thioesterase [Clostridium beijerinckii]NRT48393.1 acyl-ACP thioesterase [Clostridium beijerinckii]NRU36368.1 acyl-ACP thioesterase [Clostridium beijerinckii]NRZ23310.1 acyl-ACP thioesterase [Clostridium beijerinckii]
MSKKFTKKYEIHYYEVNSNLRCKLSSIIDFVCDVGTQQSEALGGGIDYCTKNNCAWVFYKYDIKMYRYPMFGEIISVTTEAIGFKKFYGLRKYTINDQNNNVIGEALALFFLINIDKRRPMRIQDEQYHIYGVDGDVDYDISMDKIERTNDEQYYKQFSIRYSDIDSNNHVNNVKYVEWAMEAVPLDIINNYTLKRIKVVFEKETTYGDKISSTAAINVIDENNLKSYHTIKNSEGTELTLLEADWKK